MNDERLALLIESVERSARQYYQDQSSLQPVEQNLSRLRGLVNTIDLLEAAKDAFAGAVVLIADELRTVKADTLARIANAGPKGILKSDILYSTGKKLVPQSKRHLVVEALDALVADGLVFLREERHKGHGGRVGYWYTASTFSERASRELYGE